MSTKNCRRNKKFSNENVLKILKIYLKNAENIFKNINVEIFLIKSVEKYYLKIY